MQTLLMFAGDKFYPKGGARDLMGVVPYIDTHLVFNIMRDHVRQSFGGAHGSYWCNILVVRDGTPTEKRRWRFECSDKEERFIHADESIIQSAREEGTYFVLIRQPDEEDAPDEG
jgi:hypothetical protein